MASASELISNTGNAALSIGSNANIPVISSDAVNGGNAIRETANRLMMANHANNVMLFQQKIADRDALYKALNDGQIVVGDIDPKDRPYYENAKKQQEKAFYEMAENGGINNKDAYRKYIQSTTDLAETATHVQARKIGLDQYKKDIAAEPVKAKREQIEQQYRKQLEKDSGSMIDPYQRSLDFDADKLLADIQQNAVVGSGVPSMVTTSSVRTKETPGKPTTTTRYEKTVPVKVGKGSQPITTVQGQIQTGTGLPQATANIIYKNGLPYSQTQQYVDFNRLKQNANDTYLDKTGEGTELQNQFYDKFTDPSIISHDEIKPTYDYMVKKAEEYNRARGFTPLPDGSMSAEDLANGAADTKKLIKAFNVPPDPQTGKRNINMSKPELAAYFALAHMDNYATQTDTLLKDEALLGLQERKLKGDLAIKSADAASKRQLRNAQIKKINKALEGKTPIEQQQAFEKYWATNGVSVLSPTDKVKGIKGAIPYVESRPVYTTDTKGAPKLLKPIGAKPVYDVYDKDGMPTKESKLIGYDGGYYQTQFYNKSTGQNIGVTDIQTAFKKAKTASPDLTEQQFLINLSQNGINYRLIGDKGSFTDLDNNANNLRILDNKYKSKDEQDPISSDVELFEPETE